MIIFYDHLIDNAKIDTYLDNLDIPKSKKSKLKETIDDILHTGLMEFILQKLHPHHHRTFLDNVSHSPYDPELIEYLKHHINDKIEEEVGKQAERLQKLILKDLKIS